ncbi:hypothetical protein AAGF08_04905 [Algoriphagus sp. SE2]|uniref:hypothetical protein n=1 Tax=Algoriphagus sp. SE2 TaxID=3141536 RepID=UPI0031CD24D1
MKRTFLQIALSLALLGCQKGQVKKPIILNPQSEIVVNQDSLLFEVEGVNWTAWVNTPVQVIYPQLTRINNQITLRINPSEGVIEGQAFLTLQRDENQFIYPISLKNQEAKGQLQDLRSPKTVNTDSSMIQQQVLYAFDHSGNLSELEEGVFFKENYLELFPNAGTFQGLTSTAVSSFYVDPGTVKEIPLTYSLNKYNQTVEIKAGPLKDRYNNSVSNGTLAIFFLEKGKEQKRIETVVQDSYCQLTMPLSEVENGSLKVKIAQVYSLSLIIQQP